MGRLYLDNFDQEKKLYWVMKGVFLLARSPFLPCTVHHEPDYIQASGSTTFIPSQQRLLRNKSVLGVEDLLLRRPLLWHALSQAAMNILQSF